MLFVGSVLWGALVVLSILCFAGLFLRHGWQKAQFAALPLILYFLCFHIPSGSHGDVEGKSKATLQLRHVLYSCFWFTFYIALLPLQFVDNKQTYYPPARAHLLAMYVFLNVFVILGLQFLYEEIQNMVVMVNATGGWYPWFWAFANESKPPIWVPTSTYAPDAAVTYRGHWFKSAGIRNTAAPNQISDLFLWAVFKEVDRLPRPLIFLQILVTLSLFTLLLRSNNWVAYAIMLFFNYVLLWWGIRIRKQITLKTLPLSQQQSSPSFTGSFHVHSEQAR
jgi:hypothetical protein